MLVKTPKGGGSESEGRPLNGKWLQMVCPNGDGKRRKWQLQRLRLSNSPYANSITLFQWQTSHWTAS